MKLILNYVYKIGRLQLCITKRLRTYGNVAHYIARGIYFIMTGVFPEEFYRARRGFRATTLLKSHDATPCHVNEKADIDLESIQEYLDREYWEEGTTTGKSGYSGIYSLMGIAGAVAFQFTEALDLKKKRLLDLGCGAGQAVRAFMDNGVDAYGIDLSEYAIEEGKKAFKLRERIFVGSIHDLSKWSDDSIDFLYSNQVFEHLPEKYVDRLVDECRRVLKPGGRMWVGLVLALSPDPEGIRSADDPDDTHITIHYRSWWNEKFLSAGFVLDEQCMYAVESTPIWMEYGWHQLGYRAIDAAPQQKGWIRK